MQNKKLKYKKGFTMIEIIVVISILIVVISFSAIVDLSAFSSDTFQAEEVKVVSVLERARSRAIANMLDSNHGVCYIAPNYVIFQGDTCVAGESIPANENIASHTDTIFPTVVFSRLTGNTTGATIHVTDGIKEEDITINNEGAINW